MTDTNEYNANISVRTNYIAEQSDPENQRFVFSYTITILNDGSVPARLMSRHWIITDANGEVEEVQGDGVVGEQPYLKPGEYFEYTSGTIIKTPVGSMQGSYLMHADDGNEFKAPISPFTLSQPNQIN